MRVATIAAAIWFLSSSLSVAHMPQTADPSFFEFAVATYLHEPEQNRLVLWHSQDKNKTATLSIVEDGKVPIESVSCSISDEALRMTVDRSTAQLLLRSLENLVSGTSPEESIIAQCGITEKSTTKDFVKADIKLVGYLPASSATDEPSAQWPKQFDVNSYVYWISSRTNAGLENRLEVRQAKRNEKDKNGAHFSAHSDRRNGPGFCSVHGSGSLGAGNSTEFDAVKLLFDIVRSASTSSSRIPLAVACDSPSSEPYVFIK